MYVFVRVWDRPRQRSRCPASSLDIPILYRACCRVVFDLSEAINVQYNRVEKNEVALITNDLYGDHKAKRV